MSGDGDPSRGLPHFAGDINLQAQNPDDMPRQLAAKKRLSRLSNPDNADGDTPRRKGQQPTWGVPLAILAAAQRPTSTGVDGPLCVALSES